MHKVSLWVGLCFFIVIAYVWKTGFDNAVFITFGMVIVFGIFKAIYNRGDLMTDEEERKVFEEWKAKKDKLQV